MIVSPFCLSCCSRADCALQLVERAEAEPEEGRLHAALAIALNGRAMCYELLGQSEKAAADIDRGALAAMASGKV